MDTAIESLMKSMLSSEIGQCCFQIASIENQLRRNEGIANSTLIDNGDHIQELPYRQSLHQHNSRLFNKFTRLRREQPMLADLKLNENFIKNISGVTIPREMLILLSLGPKFALPSSDFPTLDVLTDVEHMTQSISYDETVRRSLRGEMGFTITKYVKSYKRLNRILKDNPNVMVSNSDKGSVTVISSKDDYNSKIMALLDDQCKFPKVAGRYHQKVSGQEQSTYFGTESKELD